MFSYTFCIRLKRFWFVVDLIAFIIFKETWLFKYIFYNLSRQFSFVYVTLIKDFVFVVNFFNFLWCVIIIFVFSNFFFIFQLIFIAIDLTSFFKLLLFEYIYCVDETSSKLCCIIDIFLFSIIIVFDDLIHKNIV